jgi:hypothetical protein
MDIRKEILQQQTKKQINKVVDYVGDNPGLFKALVEVFLEGPYRVTQRAARPVSCCVERNPHLVRPHLKILLNYLKTPGIHDAVKRNTIRLLQYIEIPKSLHGKVADICFGYFQDLKEPIGIRVFSMTVLGQIARHNPDLKRELFILIEDQLPYASPGFTSRAKKVLKELNQP